MNISFLGDIYFWLLLLLYLIPVAFFILAYIFIKIARKLNPELTGSTINEIFTGIVVGLVGGIFLAMMEEELNLISLYYKSAVLALFLSEVVLLKVFFGRRKMTDEEKDDL